ncbi:MULTISPECIES: hypothetical protein [unclassified Providencia]|uniref:hypothetical protein n=1 Tax=unclassified Providencia TaxID=2633465 RepID=UPI0012B6039E|nr:MULTISPECIES: hypothetical protein [unclassified Providencia]MTC21802.1 hypothetical protein [Providencia sp. wls1938]
MSNQNLELSFSALSAQLAQQAHQIAILQKQVADMQKVISRGLEVSKSTMFSTQATIADNEKAFNEAISKHQSGLIISNNGDAHFDGVLISK